jgi:hypothetical protein
MTGREPRDQKAHALVLQSRAYLGAQNQRVSRAVFQAMMLLLQTTANQTARGFYWLQTRATLLFSIEEVAQLCFRGDSSIKTWIYGICVRVASEYRRRAHVVREVPEAEPATLEQLRHF